jgi:16S rRNA (guanine527-N7)-methyltransferase
MNLSMDMEDRALLVDGARAFGIQLDERAEAAFDVYLRELLKWNQKLNLTAIRTGKEIILKHFLDSLSALPHLPREAALLDMGSGAGFPGIPLKIVEPSLDVTLIDSVRKKVDFQRHILRTLNLQGIEAVHGRAQDREILRSRAGRFDLVISRAFSDLHTYLTLSAPFLRPGGRAIAMKGIMAEEEVRRLDEVEKDRFHLERIFEFVLPFSTFHRSILFFEIFGAGDAHPAF